MQLAQMVADLSSLKACDPSAATALVTANKSMSLSTSKSASEGAFPSTKEEADRAAILHDLYSLRAKLSQQDNASLMKARERINALAAERGC